MARETTYFVQAFNAGKGGNLKADAPIACKSANGALRTAERLALAQRVYIINNGHIAHEGPAQEIKAKPDILQRYLGV